MFESPILFSAIGFISLSTIYLLTQTFSFWGKPLLKAAPILLLAAIVGLTDAINTPLRWFILLALLFSAAGDIFLELDEDGNLFVWGLGSFLIGHIFYGWGFAQTIGWSPFAILPIMVIILLGVAVTWRIWSSLGALKIPVLLYIFVSMGMGFSAALYQPISQLLIGGAIVFMLSDSVIALNKFWRELPGRDFIVMSTYYAAQCLIFLGLVV